MLCFRVKLASQTPCPEQGTVERWVPAPRRLLSPIAATLTKRVLAKSGSASLSSSQERRPNASSSIAFGVSPLLATDPRSAPVTPFPATLTKTRPAKSNACHTSGKSQGVCRPFVYSVSFDFQLSTVILFSLSCIPITSLLGAFHASFSHHHVIP